MRKFAVRFAKVKMMPVPAAISGKNDFNSNNCTNDLRVVTGLANTGGLLIAYMLTLHKVLTYDAQSFGSASPPVQAVSQLRKSEAAVPLRTYGTIIDNCAILHEIFLTAHIVVR